jgi:hypothetical protein
MQTATFNSNLTMKTNLSRWPAALTAGMSLAAAVTASAQLVWNSGLANNGVIPDGDPAGWSDTRTVSGLAGPIASVAVTLSVSGGWTGDYYAFLSHAGGFAVLLNRVGRTAAPGGDAGYSDAGLQIRLEDSATNGDVHQYRNVSGYGLLIGGNGSFVPDGRNVSPWSAVDTDAATQRLNQFAGLNANGDWTLFLADLSNGAQGAVQSWGLTITPVPEPSPWAAVAGVGLAAFACWRRARRG